MSKRLRFCSLLFISVFVNLICNFLAAPAKYYNVALTDIKCSHSPNYASCTSCKLTGPAPAVGADFDMQMKKAVKELHMDVVFYLERMKKYLLLFQAPDFDVCEEVSRNQSSIYMELLRDMIARAGKWPGCPIRADTYFKFTNVTPSSDYFPPFLPQVAFKMVITMKDKKEPFMSTSVFGRIVPKHISKGIK